MSLPRVRVLQKFRREAHLCQTCTGWLEAAITDVRTHTIKEHTDASALGTQHSALAQVIANPRHPLSRVTPFGTQGNASPHHSC